MFKRQTLVRSAIASAVFSAVLVTIPAQAGLLGGSASAVGGLAGGAAGSFGPGNRNVGSAASGQGALSTNSTAALPRGDKALNAARQVTAEGQTAGQAAATSSTAMATGNATGAAQATGQGTAARPGLLSRGALTTANPVAVGANENGSAEASGAGSAQASRDSVQVRGEASAQGSVGH